MESSAAAARTFGDPPRYPIESVDNALQLMSLFGSHDRLRVKDVSEALGVAQGTAHRLLAMLQYRGYVTQDRVSKLYLPGSMLLEIGLRAAQQLDLRAVARPHLERLHGSIDETILLGVLQGTEVMFIDAIESSKTLRVTSRAGMLFPAHCTSVGKALLAGLTNEELREAYQDERLARPTKHSIGSRIQLERELDLTRERGYATNVGEMEDDIGSVAVAIRNRTGRPIAAVGVGAPQSRLTPRRVQKMVKEAQRTATAIEGEASVIGEGPR